MNWFEGVGMLVLIELCIGWAAYLDLHDMRDIRDDAQADKIRRVIGD